MHSKSWLSLIIVAAFAACGTLAAACSSSGGPSGDPSQSASDLDVDADTDPCADVRILCPSGKHCEIESGEPACVDDVPVKNGLGPTDAGAPPPNPVGFFPNPDAGDGAVPTKVGFFPE